MRILITGASGFIGRHIAQSLRREGHHVVGCVRNLRSAERLLPGIDLMPADFTTDHSTRIWRSRVKGFDVVINAVGIIRQRGRQTFSTLHTKTPIALFRACKLMGVKQIIQISALGADDTAFSHYHLSKKAADDYLAATDLNWLILMPSIVYGPGAKSMTFFKALSSLPIVPLIDQGDQQIQPIHIDDLTNLVIKSINPEKRFGKRVVLVGPTRIAMKTLFSDLRAWLGQGTPNFISVSYFLAIGLARCAGMLGDTPLSADTVAMLQRGNVGDTRQFVAETGQTPREIRSFLAETPADDRDRWHAGLYFLQPILRLSIAFVWLFTGYLSAFVFPQESSYTLLAQVGIDKDYAAIFLYGAAGLDFALGVATAMAYRVKLMGWIQIILILLYTLIITVYLPEQWIHPFGPISKNLPLLVSIMMMMTLERSP
jgi:uncharacterized protein YbjT (DUF2867 family)